MNKSKDYLDYIELEKNIHCSYNLIIVDINKNFYNFYDLYYQIDRYLVIAQEPITRTIKRL